MKDTLLRKLAKSNGAQRNALHLECNTDLGAPRYYNTRKQENRNSTVFMEDMDISEADNSGSDNDYDDFVGCLCSRTSTCKTSRCQCLEKGSHCGELCGCVSTKCTNRIMSQETTQHESGSSLKGVEDSELASQGAALLQSALTDKPLADSMDYEGSRRKPLSDIGNTLAKTNAPKPSKRKKWGKQAVHLVSIDAPANHLETPIPVAKPEIVIVSEDLPLKLPRAMRTLKTTGNNVLREINSDQVDATVSTKEVETKHSQGNVVQAQETDAKENQAL